MWLIFTLIRHVDTIRVQGTRVSRPERARDPDHHAHHAFSLPVGKGAGWPCREQQGEGGTLSRPLTGHHFVMWAIPFFLVKIFILYFIIFK